MLAGVGRARPFCSDDVSIASSSITLKSGGQNLRLIVSGLLLPQAGWPSTIILSRALRPTYLVERRLLVFIVACSMLVGELSNS